MNDRRCGHGDDDIRGDAHQDRRAALGIGFDAVRRAGQGPAGIHEFEGLAHPRRDAQRVGVGRGDDRSRAQLDAQAARAVAGIERLDRCAIDIGDGRRIDHEALGEIAEGQRVRPGATARFVGLPGGEDQHIVPVPAEQRVVSTTEDRVVAGAARHEIRCRATIDDVRTGSASDRVRRGAAQDRQRLGLCREIVASRGCVGDRHHLDRRQIAIGEVGRRNARPELHGVGPVAALDRSVEIVGHQGVVAAAADQRVDAAAAGQHIGAAIARQDVVPVAAGHMLDRNQRIRVASTRDDGRSAGRIERHHDPGRQIAVIRGVVARTTIEDVVAAIAAQDVVRRIAHQAIRDG